MQQMMRLRRVGAVLLASVLCAGPAMAEKPAWAGAGKHGNKHESRDEGSRESLTVNAGGVTVRFGEGERKAVLDYYQGQAKAGHCPPGLAKKNNGCLPPGQARKWARGKPIGGLEVHDLPYDLRVRLPAPPAGHRYVQVAADVLLIAVGTGIVVDAIEDLLR